MSRTVKLECSHPGPDYRLELSDDEKLEPGPHEVIVRVRACSVNPIDVKRAGGYGRRLLSLKGAYGSQLVLGNDFSGVVVRIGTDVKGIQPGRSVFGCVPTTARGSHAGVVKVDAAQVQLLPHGVAHEQACVLPYTFSTLWQALKALGLNEVTAKGRTVLILGASGALGTLATQVLSHWGAAVTAVARSSQAAACLRAGAVTVVDREVGGLTRLGSSFDVTLNFADWAQDQALIRCLNVGAIGHATTVHPLMANFDNLGWLRGGFANVGTVVATQSGRQGRFARCGLFMGTVQTRPGGHESLGRLARRWRGLLAGGKGLAIRRCQAGLRSCWRRRWWAHCAHATLN